jgi:nucleotide-binding universal stress UspA family protein
MKKDTRHNGKAERVAAVVVGVDGSEGAKGALRWALEEGRLREWPVRAVHAWMFGYSGGSVAGYPYWGGSPGSLASLGADRSDLQRAAEDLLERALAEVADADDVQIERQVLEGGAAEVLVRIATPVDLLVVGSRGHGGFASLLLGSVSQQCIHHAACPVVVVRPAKPTPRDDRIAGTLQAVVR